MISFKTDMREFNDTLTEYLAWNRRGTAGLVEHTLRKVVTGFSPRSKSAFKVDGMRQQFHKVRATASKIRSEFASREASNRGTLRPPKVWVSPTAKRTKNKRFPKMGYARTKKQAVKWRTKRGQAWVQATMLYANWRPSEQTKSANFKPSLGTKKGKIPPTGIKVRTTNRNPSATWWSNLEAVSKNKHFKKIRRRALRNVRRDMQMYINNKKFKSRRR